MRFNKTRQSLLTINSCSDCLEDLISSLLSLSYESIHSLETDILAKSSFPFFGSNSFFFITFYKWWNLWILLSNPNLLPYKCPTRKIYPDLKSTGKEPKYIFLYYCIKDGILSNICMSKMWLHLLLVFFFFFIFVVVVAKRIIN